MVRVKVKVLGLTRLDLQSHAQACLRLKTDDLELSDYIEPIEVVNPLGAGTEEAER
jgi:hypothetical protein